MTVLDLVRELPDIDTLRARCRAIAALEVVLNDDPGSRYFGYDPDWAEGRELAWMRNGSGDEYSIVFQEAGVFIRGFDHESAMSPFVSDDGELWPGLVDELPTDFADLVEEPAFCLDDLLAATVVVWRRWNGNRWQCGEIVFPAGDDPDGARWLFQVVAVDGTEGYHGFAQDYYQRELDYRAVREVLRQAPLTAELTRRLAPGADWARVRHEVSALGWPVG
ncbi:hypothetical protein M8C13_33520 [Crossiella sp. SN42]|uniref:hypothetical protein n=1 Tax=Crossiella sp. SN42 TaxID=2944808 RepID=UPI00207D1001|nr:hypothetical protein [Crossiella sp. SN42]MCO1580687.1 hypothetical protein [Crossiella sp. SN42]